MKKILALLLALVMCLTVLTSCDVQGTIEQVKDTVTGVVDQIKDKIDSIIDPEEPINYQIDKAEAFLKNMYKDANPVTGADYEVVGTVRVANIPYAVTWTTNTEEVKIVALENGNYLVDVNEKAPEDTPYTLTATITAGNGDKATVSYERKVPKYNVLSWDEYMASEKGDTVLVEGIVVAMNAKSLGNSRNHLFLADASGKGGYYVYQMDVDPVEAGVKVGMTVAVTGPVEPYSGMHEIKGGSFTIEDETIKTIDPIDITEYILAGNTDFSQFVALPVTIKGVTLGAQELATASSQYLYFEIGGIKSYVRTYVTDFPTTLDAKTATAENADKAAIDALHAEHFGDKADVTGILILYSGNPYLIPMSVDCFTNFVAVEMTEADKVAAELDAVTVPEGVFKDTVIDLPTAGKYFDDVTITWTSDSDAAVVGEDGKLTITLGEEATTVTLTATFKCGETTETKTYTIAVAAIVKTFNQVVDTPVVGGEYYFMMHQGNLNSDLFLTGEMSGYYYATTEVVSEAVKVKVVDAGEGAYYLMVGEKYATIVKNGNYINAVFVDETPAAKFTWNTELKTFVINVDGTDYFYGTKADGTYATMDKCKLENAANSFVANLVLVKVSTDGEVKMTADNMGLDAYAAGSVDVEGFTFGYTELGSYGNGIQMRIKDGNTSTLWNETAFSFPIKEIVLVFNSEKSTYDNTDAFKFTFGNAADALNYTTTLSTVKGEKTYTITPDSATYTYFKMELLLSYSFYWDSITVVLTEGNIVHEHAYESEVVAPTCEDKGYTLYTCKCGDIKKENYVPAIGHNFVDGDCANCDVVLTNTTVAEAGTLEDGTWVVLTGTVAQINEAWNDQYGNITVTISDGTDTFYVYRLSTKVEVGDVITITGKIGSYNGAKQIAAGATAVITGTDTPAHICTNKCPECGNCKNADCTEDVCATKCECVVDDSKTTTIAAILAGEAGVYQAEGTVIAINGRSFLLKDATGTMLVYLNAAPSVVVGDVVTVSGTTSAYGGATQFGKDSVVTKTGTAEVSHGTPVELTAAECDAYLTTEVVTPVYVKLTGVLSVNGNYMNLPIDGATIIGSLTYLADDLKTAATALNGKTIVVEGYVTGVTGSSSKYLNLMVVSVEEVVSETPTHSCESVCPDCGLCLDADCTEEVCASKCQGHNDPVVPPHTCESVCSECGKCTDAECGETACADKCEGHDPVEEPETTTGVVDPVVGTAYKFGMVQQNKNNTIYYLKGGMDSYYLATTDDYTEALDVYIETADNGYHLYCYVDDVKTYINVVTSGTHVNGAYEATASTVYTYDAESKTLIADVDGAPYWFGTRNDKTYTTVGPCAVSYNGFYCQFYNGAPEAPAHSCESVCSECGKCTDTACAEEVCANKCEGHAPVEEPETPEVGGNVELTVDSLGLASESYSAGTVTVNGVAFEFVQLGNYGDGIQMRDSSKGTSILWNTSAFGSAIVRIDLVYSSTKSTYDNPDAVIFSFGTSADNLTYTTKLSTVSGTKTYSITPDAESYTYFKLEHDYSYSMYWASITFVLADGTTVTPDPEVPEVPEEHDCESVCPECGLCLDAECEEDACADKCEGHTPVDEPEVGETTSVSKSSTDIAGIAGVTVGQNTGVIANKEIALDDNISIVCAKGGSTSDPCIYSESIRLYQGGATLTIKGTGMTKIVITLATKSGGQGPIAVTGGTADNTSAPTNYVYTITVDEGVSEVVITTKGTDKNNRLYVSNIEVFYEQ